MEAHSQVVSRWRRIEPAIVPETIEPAIVPEPCITFDVLRILDQVEELRGCDKRHTACMLNRLGDLRL